MDDYVVMFEIEKGEYVYDTGKDIFTNYDPAITFATEEEALKRAAKWNTGIVIHRNVNIREMTRDERDRAKVRASLNGEVKHD